MTQTTNDTHINTQTHNDTHTHNETHLHILTHKQTQTMTRKHAQIMNSVKDTLSNRFSHSESK